MNIENSLPESLKEQNSAKKLVHMISLGCARNRVDSEVMVGKLLGDGWGLSHNPAEADVVVVNTCGFIESAKEESIDTILQMSEFKHENPNLKLVVAGCLTQRYKSQLAKGLPEVDFFIGTDEFSKIDDFLKNPPPKGSVFAKRTHYLYSNELPRVNTLNKQAAYVKVAEGCQHNCAFCIIPAIRGKLRSRPIENVIREVEQLVGQGVKEINLIAQDLAAYGRDLKDTDLLALLKELVKIEGLRWIRLLYVYPENISEEFLDFFAKQAKLVKYLDIPMQHASSDVLKRMNRGVTREELETTIAKVRARVPGMVIRTSVMVGFPGETEEDFSQLLDFVKQQKFDHLGCFTYSQEEGTVAGRMPNQIEDSEKKKRLKKIMTLQKKISKSNLENFLGQTIEVLVESKKTDDMGTLWVGRARHQAPEVDGLTYLRSEVDLVAGNMYWVKITDSFDYDLLGEVIELSDSAVNQSSNSADNLSSHLFH